LLIITESKSPSELKTAVKVFKTSLLESREVSLALTTYNTGVESTSWMVSSSATIYVLGTSVSESEATTM